MTPQRQFAESVKYTAQPIILIPVEAGFIIMEVTGYKRNYLRTVTPAELAAWATNDFARQQSLRAEAMKRQPLALDLDCFDFKL